MQNFRWLFLFLIFISSMGCATLSVSTFDNIFEANPNIGPDELPTALKAHPVEDTQIGSSFRYQVYNLNFFGTRKEAVYFKDGQMIGKDPTYRDKFENLDVLLKLGAISQQQHDDPCGTHVPGFVDQGCGCGQPPDQGCGCGQPSPSGCDNQCGSTKTNDTCGVCGGDGSSCAPPPSQTYSPSGTCYGNSCNCSGVVDCSGACNGSATIDVCGQCGGNGSECAPPS